MSDATRFLDLKPNEKADWAKFLIKKQKAELTTGPFAVPHPRALLDHPHLSKEFRRLIVSPHLSIDDYHKNWNSVLDILSFVSGARLGAKPIKRQLTTLPVAGQPARYVYVSNSVAPPINAKPNVSDELFPGTSIAQVRENLAIESISSKRAQKLYTGSKPIGEGGYGRVYVCKSKELKQKVAIKRIRVDSRAEKKILVEILAYSELNHPNVVKVFHSKLTDASYWIVMEFLEGGNLVTARRLYKFQ